MKTYLRPIIAIAGLLLSSGCFQMFGSGPVSELKVNFNKEKTKEAILFLKGGDATVADSYHVSVKKAGAKLEDDEVGNVFTADGNHGKTILNSNSIRFQWANSDTLIVRYDKALRTFTQLSYIDGVSIVYKPF